jgi:hypothetical protein
MSPTAYRTTQEPAQRVTIRSVWLVTPVTPGSQALETSYDVQPDKEAIRTANSGITAHLFLRFGSKIDPSISFRYKTSLCVN